MILASCGEERSRDQAPAQSVHAPGLLDPASPGFHGTVLRDRGWRFELCQSCHGQDYDGGTSSAACTTCHDDGPTACATCHGEGRRYEPAGAHAAHRETCDACHRVPARWDEPGHILVEDHSDPAPAEVVLGALAARDLQPPRRMA